MEDNKECRFTGKTNQTFAAEDAQTFRKLKRASDSAYNRAFVRQLDFWLAQKGWNDRELSHRSNVRLSTICSWKRNGTLPSVISIAKICQALGILFEDLAMNHFTEEEEAAIQRFNDFKKKRCAQPQQKK